MVEYNQPMSQYLADKGYGSGTLKKILNSPADFKAGLTWQQKSTAAKELGTATHALLLEPDLFRKEFALQPEPWGPRNKGEGYKKWKKFKEDNEGLTLVGWEDATLLRRIAYEKENHQGLQDILEDGKSEVSAYIEHNGIRYKARADWLTSDNFIWDLKTTSKDIDDDSLARTIFHYGYHFQAAHHSWVFRQAGIPIQGWGWIFVSTGTPAVHIITRKCSLKLYEAGFKDHTYAVSLLEKCTKEEKWPGYGDDVKEICLPKYAEKDYQ